MPELKKLESNITSLGEATGQVKSVEGKLVQIVPSNKFQNKKNYVLETADGKQTTVFGSAFIDQRINPSFIGKYVKFEYKGIDPKSRAKIIDVYVEQ